ncbi:MAG: PQQ-binding-like beta-propeller repeat protein [Pirellulales bacterium]
MPAFAIRSLGVLLVLVSTASADDWPQWMGPKRDNVWREEGLLEKFPEGGPKVLWRVPVAGGYAGPAVVGDRVYVTDYVTDDNVKVDNFARKQFTGIERVLCLDAATGEEKWKHEYPVKYTISYPAGPRCTPVFENGKVYTLGAEGNLFCFDADSGDLVWQKNLPEKYQTKAALWGYANHPLIDGDKLICIAGGDDTHAVAFNKNTGEEIWHALTSPEQGYSPPTIVEAGGKRQLILLRADAVSSVDPETGAEYWSEPYRADNGCVVMSPVRSANYLYFGSFNNKNMLLELASDRPEAEVVWGNKPKHGVAAINVQPHVVDSTMYGIDQDGRLYAVELPSGKRLWGSTEPISTRAANSGTAFIVRQGDTGNRYWLFNDSGDLIIANLTPAGYKEIDRAHLLDPTNFAYGREVVWCMPAYANKRMYVRNDKEFICVDLAAGK